MHLTADFRALGAVTLQTSLLLVKMPEITAAAVQGAKWVLAIDLANVFFLQLFSREMLIEVWGLQFRRGKNISLEFLKDFTSSCDLLHAHHPNVGEISLQVCVTSDVAHT